MQREDMKKFIADNCLLSDSPTTLSSGETASFYFDCKRATLNGFFLSSLADWILQQADAITPPINVVGGPTIGADFIASAVILRAATQGHALTTAAIVRKEPKRHGTKNKIENEPQQPSSILVVEDVITTGGSIAKACDEFIAAGHRIAAIVAIIDRLAGGKQTLEKNYQVAVNTLFTKDDFNIA